MFDKATYIGRRNALRAAVGSGVLVFPGNSLSAMNYKANCYPFRQDSNFLYYFGLDVPNLAAVIDVDSGREILFADEQTIDDQVWSGPLPSWPEQAGKCGVNDCRAAGEIADYLQKAQAGGRIIHFLPFYRAEQLVQASNWLSVTVGEMNAFVSPTFIKTVAAQRSIKTAEEIAQIELAVDLTGKMQQAAMQAVMPGRVEAEIVAELMAVAAAKDCGLSFPPIFSVHGETLHNPYYRNIMENGQTAVCDCGAESPLHYAGDLTRTIPVGGRFSTRQKEIYNIVLQAQTAAIDRIEPGIPFREIHLFACEKLTSGLQRLGLMKGDIKEAVAAGAHALFFQCGLGHMMGLDVHDMESLGEQFVGYGNMPRSSQFGLKSLRLAKELEVGNVITVEPGIYFIPQLIDMWQAQGKFDEYINYHEVEKYRDFGGIRIEDDVFVTESGSRILGLPVPKTVAEVEQACER
ncbi:MAG: aminopeptidase P N-terminal domain-containing protein [Sedimentisphaerales bacterium]|nr:aminopeptidase P N-terminal domain-containing protein [Sedimentisphaerales bacterium]MBN2842124.1 aminopeptidase P N-terminal domain-containing protein [Sedimentisphaerales bacterium]